MISHKLIKICLTLFLVFAQQLSSFAQQDSISYLALGDSYTDGSFELRINSWPYQLAAQLRKRKIHVGTPKIIAKPGWTTSNLLDAIQSTNPNPNFELVSLLIGVNNQYKGKDFYLFKEEFPILLEKSIQLAKNNPKNVIVVSIPDWSVTPFARFKDKMKITKELETYNALIKEEATNYGVNYIDITQISRNAKVNPDWIASDSLHPSKKMYKAWAKKISKKIKFQKR